MATTPDTSASAPAPSRGKRVLLVVLAFVVVAGVAAALFGKKAIWQSWANVAHEKDSRAAIVAEQDPGIVAVLVSTMRDSGKSDKARLACADILVHDKNRIADVEKALTDPDVDVRRIALKALSREAYFQRQYVADPAYGVEQTMTDWITKATTRRREDALALTSIVWPLPKAGEASKVPPAVLDAVAHVLEDPETADDGGLRAAAARVLRIYSACAHLPRILAAAKAENDAQTRLAETDAVVDLAARDCKKEATEADVRALVEANFTRQGESQHDRALRMRAMSVLGQHPEWAKAHVAGIRNVLATAANPAERRSAFEALLAVEDPPTMEGFARWFHDPYAGIRSAAAEAVADGLGGLSVDEHLALLVGYVREETVKVAQEAGRLHTTLSRLRTKAGSWVGAPERLKTAGPIVAQELLPFVDGILLKGEAQGVTRAAFADAWWRWMARQYGVADEDVDRAAATRDAFWTAAKRGDAPAAKATLDGAAVKDARVYEYERGWLASRGK